MPLVLLVILAIPSIDLIWPFHIPEPGSPAVALVVDQGRIQVGDQNQAEDQDLVLGNLVAVAD